MQELHTPSEIIDELGGNAAVAAITGSKPKAVWNWRKAPTLPARTYVVVIGALHERGKTAPPSVWGMAQ